MVILHYQYAESVSGSLKESMKKQQATSMVFDWLCSWVLLVVYYQVNVESHDKLS